MNLRLATLNDVPQLQSLMEQSARALAHRDYTEVQIETALKGVWGVDTQLIRDETYFVVENDVKSVACGGWSPRKTLFGSDAHEGREPELLDPKKDAARIRAFFVHPDFARKGIGRILLERCEGKAQKEGFRAAELVATLPGVRLYAACGYEEFERKEYEIGAGVTIEFVKMRKVF